MRSTFLFGAVAAAATAISTPSLSGAERIGNAIWPQMLTGPGAPSFGTDLTPSRILAHSAFTSAGGIWAVKTAVKARNKKVSRKGAKAQRPEEDRF